MKSRFLLVFFYFTLEFSTAQLNPIQQWGKVSQTEVDMQSYSPDPEAEALVLFDLGDSFFTSTDRGFRITFKRFKRIKILKDTGTKYGEIVIPLYKDGTNIELLRSIEAVAYNFENGTLSKSFLDKKDVYDEKLTDNIVLKKCAIPNARKGTVIEIRYEIETPFLFNLPDWEFQSELPTVYSEYIVHIIPFYEYVFIAQGLSNFDVYSNKPDPINRSFAGVSYNDQIYTFGVKDLPAFRDEAFLTSRKDYISKIDFQLAKIHHPTGGTEEVITSWPIMIEELLKHEDFGRYIKKCGSFAEELVDGIHEPTAQQIIEAVRESFNWDGYYRKYASKSPKELFQSKTGTSAEINLLLTAALQTAGFEADPVIISTRGNGKIRSDYPFSHYFNSVLVLVKDKNGSFMTDGTTNSIAYNRVPPQCVNEKGLVIKEVGKDNVSWIDLSSSVTSVNSVNFQFKLSEDWNLLCELSNTASEYEAFQLRNTTKDDSLEIKNYFQKNGLLNAKDIKSVNYSNPHKPIAITCNGRVSYEEIEKQIIFNPFLNFPIEENFLKQKERNYPVDLIYSFSEEFNTVLKYHSGVKLTSFPANFKMNNDLATIVLETYQGDAEIRISGSYTFKKSIYNPSEYERLKSYFDLIVRKFNEPVVFEKL